jgi:hypothetical protein
VSASGKSLRARRCARWLGPSAFCLQRNIPSRTSEHLDLPTHTLLILSPVRRALEASLLSSSAYLLQTPIIAAAPSSAIMQKPLRRSLFQHSSISQGECSHVIRFALCGSRPQFAIFNSLSHPFSFAQNCVASGVTALHLWRQKLSETFPAYHRVDFAVNNSIGLEASRARVR